MASITTAASILLLLIAADAAEVQRIERESTSSAAITPQDSWPFGFESHDHNTDDGEEEGRHHHYANLEEWEEDSVPGHVAVAARRALFWHKMRYYISYGALSANRVPCPPRSGRSYYTHDCYHARGPVHPYYRGCSAITHCRR